MLSLKGRPKNNGTIEGDIKFANLATFGGFAFKIKRTFPFSPNNKDTYLWVGAIPRGSKGIEKELSTSQKYWEKEVVSPTTYFLKEKEEISKLCFKNLEWDGRYYWLGRNTTWDIYYKI